LLHGELLNQAKVLPEGADPGLLSSSGPSAAGPGLPLPKHPALLRCQQAIGHGKQGAFASSAGTQQGDPFTGINLKRHPIKARLAAALDGDVLEDQ
jgi:hypothetical protein